MGVMGRVGGGGGGGGGGGVPVRLSAWSKYGAKVVDQTLSVSGRPTHLVSPKSVQYHAYPQVYDEYPRLMNIHHLSPKPNRH